MIALVASQQSAEAARFVVAALERSVSRTQACWIVPAAIETTHARVLVVIDPTEDMANQVLAWLKRGPRKLILFGHLPERLINHLRLQVISWPADSASWSRSDPAPMYGFAESLACIRYEPLAHGLAAVGWYRPFERFDFTDEWNNLGYGAIRADGSMWSIAAPLRAASMHELAKVDIGGEAIATYCGLFNDTYSSIFWCNRSVGPIDSFEWRIVEKFLASWRHEDLPCHPVLQEVPWGHDAAVTMRLDCDEDVESARVLWGAYRDMGVPFSLAVHTSNLAEQRHHRILRELADAGESILSHTATHAFNWGGSYNAAFAEGVESARCLRKVIGRPVRYAVSPFHQSPPYALSALADAGYQGCIGGIIRNDPEFLIARGGYVAGLPQGFVGHSQQHMLHGDCLLSEGDPLAIYKAAFDRAWETRTLFGYLDHPFSERYQYGWKDEASRMAVHQELVRYIRARASAPIFLSEDRALDFLNAKTQWSVVGDENEFCLVGPSADVREAGLWPTIEYQDREIQAVAGAISL